MTVARALVVGSALGLAIVAHASCSVTHRSQEFACGPDNTCTGANAGRVCVDGYCVDPGGPDAAIPDAHIVDAGSGSGNNMCPSVCTSCDFTKGPTCNIDCMMTSACKGTVVCPPGFACNVSCDVATECRSGIDCSQATACNIGCTGAGTCRNITCGAGPCSIDCAAQESCHNVTCSDSCACDVMCAQSINNTICTGVTCTPNCDSLPNGCTSQTPGCNTCP